MSRNAPQNLIDESPEARESANYDVNIFEFNNLLADHLNTLDENKKISKWDEEGVNTSIRLIEEYKASRITKMLLTYKHYNKTQTFNIIRKRASRLNSHKPADLTLCLFILSHFASHFKYF